MATGRRKGHRFFGERLGWLQPAHGLGQGSGNNWLGIRDPRPLGTGQMGRLRKNRKSRLSRRTGTISVPLQAGRLQGIPGLRLERVGGSKKGRVLAVGLGRGKPLPLDELGRPHALGVLRLQVHHGRRGLARPPGFLPRGGGKSPGAINFVFDQSRTGKDLVSFQISKSPESQQLEILKRVRPSGEFGYRERENGSWFRVYAPREPNTWI